MNYPKIHEKWQSYWAAGNTNAFDINSKKPKYYSLEMFPYPSGANLHLGHFFNFAPCDTHARFRRMCGFNVFHPMGFDSFGLPAENHALATNTHPRDNTSKNIEKFRAQLAQLGGMYDWTFSLTSSDPEYYKWTQWLFLQLFDAGLAYQKEAAVNWCDKCKTVLANEQVNSGECERCSSEVHRKNMKQWFFKITEYAEELLCGLDRIDWPVKTKAMQRNWIGKSEGAMVRFPLGNEKKQPEKSGSAKEYIEVFTTRIDTIFGATFLVLAPEHPLVKIVTTKECLAKVDEYIKKTAKKSEQERIENHEKTGVFTGGYAINPASGQAVPIYIADYVLVNYGTGAIMAVPAHDERDGQFAKVYGCEIKEVVKDDSVSAGARRRCRGLFEHASDVLSQGCASSADEPSTPSLTESSFTTWDGILVNSGRYNGLASAKARAVITADLGKEKLACPQTTYRLRDWSIGRQRYWGAPIPIIYCPVHGTVPVPEADLPVVLPYITDFKPHGAPPLANSPDFVNTTCPICGGTAKRETETLDTFVCSSWYFLRYPSVRCKDADALPFDKDITKRFLPVDRYIGGAEHACMHLLYARFITKFLHKQGYINFDEPFKSLVHQGMILARDGSKMSKSKGNTITPDDYIREYGSDILRLYMLFGFNYIEGGPWNDSTLKTVTRFTERIHKVITQINTEAEADPEVQHIRARTIAAVRSDLDNFSFNTAVARCMEFLNAISAAKQKSREAVRDLVLLTAPMFPHIAEEFWEMLGNGPSIFDQSYPVANEKFLTRDNVEIVVQVNSKIRARITLGKDAPQSDAKAAAAPHIDGVLPEKIIYIPNKLINFICRNSK